jgi:hypothetical protein
VPWRPASRPHRARRGWGIGSPQPRCADPPSTRRVGRRPPARGTPGRTQTQRRARGCGWRPGHQQPGRWRGAGSGPVGEGHFPHLSRSRWPRHRHTLLPAPRRWRRTGCPGLARRVSTQRTGAAVRAGDQWWCWWRLPQPLQPRPGGQRPRCPSARGSVHKRGCGNAQRENESALQGRLYTRVLDTLSTPHDPTPLAT